MGQRLEILQGKDRRWLSLLIDAMEEAARPEIRSQPVEGEVLLALRAQLAQPAPRFAYTLSAALH